MKRVINTVVAVIATSVVISCMEEVRVEKNILIPDDMVFTARTDQDAETKTTVEKTAGAVAAYLIKWENTDKIKINGVSYSAHPEEYDARVAKFTKDSGENPSAPFKAIYPASLYVSENLYRAPAEIVYEAGKFNIPMYSESDTTFLSFSNIFAVLKISVPDTVNVKKLEVSSDLYLNGPFTISSNIASIVEGDGATKKTSLTFSEPVAGTDFFIPVPAGIYTGKNLKVVLTKSNDSTETMTANQNAVININASSMYGFSFKKDGVFVLGSSDKKVSASASVL